MQPTLRLSQRSHTTSPSRLSPQLSVLETPHIVSHLESSLLEESETKGVFRREPKQASHDAAVDRMELPHLAPIDLSSPLVRMVVDPALNIFLFVNPTSGGNAAARFMEGGLEHLRLTVGMPVNLWIWDIRQGNSGQKPGFMKLKRVVEGIKNRATDSSFLSLENVDRAQQSTGVGSDKFAYVIVAGGDGTVMWCITELWVHGIDDEWVALGVVPYGTGNDFARALGWQKFNAVRPYHNKFKALKELIQEWLHAKVVYHDIWELVMRIHPEGTFQKIDPETRNKKNVHETSGDRPETKPSQSSVELTPREVSQMEQSIFETPGGPRSEQSCVLRLKMSNYFSCGIESRIGVGFDRYRTKSQLLNKMRYAIEGFKKASCRRIEKINNVADTLVEECEDGRQNILFTTDKKRNELQLSPGTISLVASNIPSFGAGLDLWKSAKNLGVKESSGQINAALRSHEQKLGDGILEFVSLNSVLEWALERGIPGRAKRVCMGGGPFELKFKDVSQSSKHFKPDTRFYCQVDGEFFIMTRPDSIQINLKRRIKVLASSSLDAPYLINAH